MANGTSRRTALTLVGGMTSVAFLSGCLGNDEGGGDDEENDDEDDNNGDNDDGGNGEGNGEQDLDPSEWEDVDTIELLGNASGWVGAEPELIADITNPTLILFEGDEYGITWVNDDAGPHNIAVRDDGDEVVEDYKTEISNEPGKEQTLEIEAASEMSEYVCEPHVNEMAGEIQIE